MARQLRKTLVDYLVIAISPALIMALVGSLVFFLLEVFYRGNFEGRLEYIFALFVIGAVLIGRISIEEGRERAALSAIPLGIAVLLAINRFVAFQGAILAPLSFLINCGLIALIWWSADKLTWDCTLIDESEEDSGEGLLEAVGLDTPGKAALQETEGGQSHFRGGAVDSRNDVSPAAKIGTVPSEPEATTSRDEPSGGWWQRFVERRRRPHAPGVWVIYFSLAALPLFGIGQLFIPAGNMSSRQYAFDLLCVYTGSGLGLLLTTSFLGLRRYLRQRRQEMPLSMVNLWLGIGVALIVVVMLCAMLVPRPNAEYAISELPVRIGSPDQTSSQYGQGGDGVKEKQPWARGQQMDEQASDSVPSDQSGKAPSKEPLKSSQDGKAPAAQEKGKADTQSGKGNQDSPNRTKDRADAAGKPQPENARPQRPENARPQRQGDSRKPTESAPLRAFPHLKVPLNAPALFLSLFKWLFYGALVLLAIYGIWTNREALLAALGNFGQWWSNFWNRLFGGVAGGAAAEADEAAAKGAPPRRFADFTDPFAAGTAGRYAPEELVRYTFEALEAWARDHGAARPPEQTPHEFARRLAPNVSLADDAGRLAELYCQVAYAPGTLPAASVARLARLWQNMKQNDE